MAACAISSSSSSRWCAKSLVERAGLLKTAPHLVEPLRFLLPIYGWQKRPAILLHAGLAPLRPAVDRRRAAAKRPPQARTRSPQLPRLRRDDLNAVLHYHDCQTDDARLVLAVLLDARARGADILNRRAVTAIEPLANGYAVELDERGVKRRVDARFIVNAAGPFVGAKSMP